jgi:hypothetical protein
MELSLADMIANSLDNRNFEREYGCTREEWDKKQAEYEAIKASAAPGQRVYMKDSAHYRLGVCTVTGKIVEAKPDYVTVEWLDAEHSEQCNAWAKENNCHPLCWLEQPGKTTIVPFYRLERKVSTTGNIYWSSF